MYFRSNGLDSCGLHGPRRDSRAPPQPRRRRQPSGRGRTDSIERRSAVRSADTRIQRCFDPARKERHCRSQGQGRHDAVVGRLF